MKIEFWSKKHLHKTSN